MNGDIAAIGGIWFDPVPTRPALDDIEKSLRIDIEANAIVGIKKTSQDEIVVCIGRCHQAAHTYVRQVGE